MKKFLLGIAGVDCAGCSCFRCGSRCASLREGARDDRGRVRLERFLHRRQRRLGFEPQVLGPTLNLRSSAFAASEGCHDATGGTAGGQIGYRWQAGAWVFGVEAQGNWADFKGRNASLVDFGGRRRITNRTSIDAFGLFTGQVGYAFNNVLLYVKGGAAVTDSRFQGVVTGTNIVADQHRIRHPLGRHRRRRPRIRLLPELVGCRRVRPPVHGQLSNRQFHAACLSLRRSRRAPRASARTSTSSPSASTIAGAARSSRSTNRFDRTLF